MPQLLQTPTTSAGPSAEFIARAEPAGRGTLPAHFTCPGLAGVETGTLQKKNANGAFTDYYVNEAKQVVTATNTAVVVYAAGIYRMDKTATAAAVGAEVSTDSIP